MLLVVLGLVAGCAREALPEICPIVEPGELVISELRGRSDDVDWIELYNAGSNTLDLYGLRVELVLGDALRFTLIRDELELPPGEVAVIGFTKQAGAASEYLDYQIEDLSVLFDAEGGSAGFVRLEGCDNDLLDEIRIVALPEGSTLACGNADSPPDASANDETSTGCWCIDAAAGGPAGLVGYGTPGELNRCP